MKMKKRMFVAACIVMVATLSVFAAGPGEDVKAPEEFKVKFETSAGDFIVEVHREDAPNGVDRFYDAVKQGFYNECRFFRVVPDFVVQFGINGDPKEQKLWRDATIEDDKVKLGNERGVL
jgi:peptidyl-prolyl cis-trans isomerase A (cyclophilin A)